mmetsp:Transcript_100368/g.259660  ORF Transcript_100368/g.259660 Transcript_100368/m.259660 type:complete len:204 (-) Transcript_100368:74-685(-)
MPVTPALQWPLPMLHPLHTSTIGRSCSFRTMGQCIAAATPQKRTLLMFMSVLTMIPRPTALAETQSLSARIGSVWGTVRREACTHRSCTAIAGSVAACAIEPTSDLAAMQAVSLPLARSTMHIVRIGRALAIARRPANLRCGCRTSARSVAACAPAIAMSTIALSTAVEMRAKIQTRIARIGRALGIAKRAASTQRTRGTPAN